MVDVAPLFALGQGLAEQAIATGGTTVRAETRTATVDPDTLEPVVSPVPVFAETGALVVPAGTLTSQPLPGVEVRVTDWRVILPTATTPPPVGAHLVVVTSRNPNLPGKAATVLGRVSGSDGAVLVVFARPEA